MVERFRRRRTDERPPADRQLSLSLDASASPAPGARRAPGPPVAGESGIRQPVVGATTADALHAHLRSLGLRGIERVRLTRNRTVMVSFRGGELRIHEGYLSAPADVLRAVVTFVNGRTRAERARARELILAHQIARPAPARRRPTVLPEDAPVVRELVRTHAVLNARHFGGRLRALPIRLSGRMRTRLGHYTAASPVGESAEIVISRDHIRRHGWDEAVHTLLHEMVHQWQDETGRPIDHGATFRSKAREVGVTASARRTVIPRRQRQASPAAKTSTIGLRAARDE
jgi:hypothetical protein